MASLNKQQRRAQRAKVKAKHTRIQRAAANRVSYDDIGFEPMDLSDMFLDASSVALSVEEREGCFVMTAIIDHDEAYAPSTGDCTCCLPTNRDH